MPVCQELEGMVCSMGFQERNAWACGGVLLVVFVPYFWLVSNNPLLYGPLLMMAVIGQVALLAGFHIVNSIATASIRKTGDVPLPDELDRIIELRAAKLSGIILGIAVVSWSMAAMAGGYTIEGGGITSAESAGAGAAAVYSIELTDAMAWVHFLFAGLVVSNLAYYGAIVTGYRRLADG